MFKIFEASLNWVPQWPVNDCMQGSWAVSGGGLCTYIGHNYVQMQILRQTSHVINIESIGEQTLLSNTPPKYR